MREISAETIAEVKRSLCGDCGGGCSQPERCEDFVDACREMDAEYTEGIGD